MRFELKAWLLLLFTTTLGELTEEQQDEIVDAHNYWRNQAALGKTGGPEASKMLTMYWSDELAENAAAWAQKCIWGHSKDKNWDPTPNPIEFYGENLYIAFGPRVTLSWIRRRIKGWAEEYQWYNYGTRKCQSGKQCGHYTQVVWDKSYAVGCDIHKCETMQGGFDNADYLVCMYMRAGNINPRINPPYRSGTPRSQCGNVNDFPEIAGIDADDEYPGLCRNGPASESTLEHDAKVPWIAGGAFGSSGQFSGGFSLPGLHSSAPLIPGLNSAPPNDEVDVVEAEAAGVEVEAVAVAEEAEAEAAVVEETPEGQNEEEPEKTTDYTDYYVYGGIGLTAVVIVLAVICIICFVCSSGSEAKSSANIGEAVPTSPIASSQMSPQMMSPASHGQWQPTLPGIAENQSLLTAASWKTASQGGGHQMGSPGGGHQMGSPGGGHQMGSPGGGHQMGGQFSAQQYPGGQANPTFTQPQNLQLPPGHFAQP